MNQVEEESIYHSLEEEAIDVGSLLMEPRCDQLSVNNVWSYEENNTGKCIRTEDASYNLDSNIRTGYVKGTKLNALDVLPHKAGMENLLLTSGISPCDEYLLDLGYVDPGGCIDYVSNEGLHVGNFCSQSQFPMNGSFEIRNSLTESLSGSECQNYFLNNCNFGLSTKSSESKIVDRFEDFSKSFIDQETNEDTQFEQNETEITPFCQDVVPISSAQDHGVDAPTNKRSRKPTKRYIDESSLLTLTNCKKRKEASSVSKVKNKASRVGRPKLRKDIEPKENLSSYEVSFGTAIQVPFISQGSTECEKNNSPRQKNNSQRQSNNLPPQKNNSPRQKNNSPREKNNSPPQKNSSPPQKSNLPRQRNNLPPQRNNSPQKNNSAPQKKNSPPPIEKHFENYTSESEEDDSETLMRSVASGNLRKHHKVWSVSEVKKLIDGVAQFGVGKWTHIKKLLFASSVHRTSVDLKDKWRNLLKASQALKGDSIQDLHKRNQPWRPLPKPILCRVIELASAYPYPRENKSKFPLAHHVSSPARIKSSKIPVV
ncbi:putative transcription factor MYB-related family protein [Tanacetum coccineum]